MLKSPKKLSGQQKIIPLRTLLELAQKGLTHEQIATIAGCSRANVSKRLKRYRTYLKGVRYFRKNRSGILVILQKRILATVTEKSIQETPLHQRIQAVEMLYDMERLERGQSTSNNGVALSELTDIERQQLEKLLRQWRQKQAGASATQAGKDHEQ